MEKKDRLGRMNEERESAQRHGLRASWLEGGSAQQHGVREDRHSNMDGWRERENQHSRIIGVRGPALQPGLREGGSAQQYSWRETAAWLERELFGTAAWLDRVSAQPRGERDREREGERGRESEPER
jgi:hypothetical protein